MYIELFLFQDMFERKWGCKTRNLIARCASIETHAGRQYRYRQIGWKGRTFSVDAQAVGFPTPTPVVQILTLMDMQT